MREVVGAQISSYWTHGRLEVPQIKWVWTNNHKFHTFRLVHFDPSLSPRPSFRFSKGLVQRLLMPRNKSIAESYGFKYSCDEALMDHSFFPTHYSFIVRGSHYSFIVRGCTYVYYSFCLTKINMFAKKRRSEHGTSYPRATESMWTMLTPDLVPRLNAKSAVCSL